VSSLKPFLPDLGLSLPDLGNLLNGEGVGNPMGLLRDALLQCPPFVEQWRRRLEQAGITWSQLEAYLQADEGRLKRLPYQTRQAFLPLFYRYKRLPYQTKQAFPPFPGRSGSPSRQGKPSFPFSTASRL
jgi:hypothetical protein